MITACKTINLQRDRLGRRPLIATASTTARIHPISNAFRAHEFQNGSLSFLCSSHVRLNRSQHPIQNGTLSP